MGHLRNYTIGDVTARFYKLLGFNVLHPMGGTVLECLLRMLQLKIKLIPRMDRKKYYKHENSTQKIGLSFDWNREISIVTRILQASTKNFYRLF